MANAGGAWDNAKKIVEVDLRMKSTPLHEATVVGDTVGDPFKDTSSVAMNPVIKFTTLFGLLAVEIAVTMHEPGARRWRSAPSCSWSRWSSSTARSTACGFRRRSREFGKRSPVGGIPDPARGRKVPPTHMSPMHKKARKNMVGLGVFFTVARAARARRPVLELP